MIYNRVYIIIYLITMETLNELVRFMAQAATWCWALLIWWLRRSGRSAAGKKYRFLGKIGDLAEIWVCLCQRIG